ncbi:hypothetical protein [Curtobacterium sp. MCBA15_012]|uniref:hypothetical protein n=1 Tax=unclassified Curtobacterium TaxID=257496 RepID=UPI00082719A9|nr:hypothetical protein [Curtobacterium sp. MCBA15_012]WIA99341.1 hypothetical protein QOL15_12520 [Curtobacterium sp. MCBA15_012]
MVAEPARHRIPDRKLLVSAGDDTGRSSMSRDDDDRTRRQALWLGVASLLVNSVRLLVDLLRKG